MRLSHSPLSIRASRFIRQTSTSQSVELKTKALNVTPAPRFGSKLIAATEVGLPLTSILQLHGIRLSRTLTFGNLIPVATLEVGSKPRRGSTRVIVFPSFLHS